MAVKKKPVVAQTRLEILRESEALLRRTLMDAEPANVAALARELRATVAEIAEIEAVAPPEVSLAETLAQRRQAKLSAVDSSLSGRRGQPRRRGGEHRAG